MVVDLTVFILWLDWTILQVFSSIKDSMNFIIFAPVMSFRLHAVFQTTSALGTRNLKSILVSSVGQGLVSNPLSKWQSTVNSPYNRERAVLGWTSSLSCVQALHWQAHASAIPWSTATSVQYQCLNQQSRHLHFYGMQAVLFSRQALLYVGSVVFPVAWNFLKF